MFTLRSGSNHHTVRFFTKDRGTMVSPSRLPINGWEVRALKYQFPDQPTSSSEHEEASPAAWRPLQDSVIYPGLYSRSGYDVVSLLFRVMSRPNPKIQLGAVDCSAAIIVCDLALADSPIVYASDPFCELTGYSVTECLGRNCRFLQQQPKSTSGKRSSSSSSSSSKPCSDEANQVALKQLHHAVHNVEETQVAVTNFKKNGERFTNLVSIVPLEKESSGNHYAIGFQVQID